MAGRMLTNRRPLGWGAAGLAAVGLALGLWAAAATGAPPKPYGGPGTVHGPRPAPDCHALPAPCPPSLPPAALAAGFDFVNQLSFRPPPPGAAPAVDGREAEDIAWQEDASAGGASVQQALLALVPAGGNIPEDTLVWVVQYRGGCITPSRTISSYLTKTGPDPCVPATWNTVIDATTGDFIYAFTDSRAS